MKTIDGVVFKSCRDEMSFGESAREMETEYECFKIYEWNCLSKELSTLVRQKKERKWQSLLALII